jgi:hypothetical protein
MTGPGQAVKMVPVKAALFEAIGYDGSARTLHIKMLDGSTLRFENVPHFRYDGFFTAPRKDAYYNTFIKGKFLTKTAAAPPA